MSEIEQELKRRIDILKRNENNRAKLIKLVRSIGATRNRYNYMSNYDLIELLTKFYENENARKIKNYNTYERKAANVIIQNLPQRPREIIIQNPPQRPINEIINENIVVQINKHPNYNTIKLSSNFNTISFDFLRLWGLLSQFGHY